VIRRNLAVVKNVGIACTPRELRTMLQLSLSFSLRHATPSNIGDFQDFDLNDTLGQRQGRLLWSILRECVVSCTS
jgi:hypothetical protein